MSADAKAPVSPGDVLAGKYRVERVLGAGAMGVVVVAMHTQLEQRVAIKFLLPDVLYDESAVQRFAREAKAAARIRSEHVVRVLDVATLERGEPYMVMEYLEGRDLEAVLADKGPFSMEDGVDYVLQALEALCEAHLAGVVHRDLKPSNIFLASRPDGSPIVKILDFGISKIASVEQQAMTQTQAILGSPLYMAPEQMRTTKTVDRRADIWSMGVVLYQLLTAKTPFVAETMPQLISTVMFDPAPRASAVRAGLPPAIDDVVTRCLEKEPDRRFQNVGELAAALAPFAPPHAQTSVDRIQRMMRTSGVDLPHVRVSQPKLAAAPALSQSGPSRVLTASEPVAEAWQATHGGKREGRRSRAAIAAAVAGALAIGGVGVMLSRGSAAPAAASGASASMHAATILPSEPPAAPSAAPGSASAAVAPGIVSAVSPLASDVPLSATASGPGGASSRGSGPRPAPAGRPPSSAATARGTAPSTSTGAAPSAHPPAPASPSGGLSDFGGRH